MKKKKAQLILFIFILICVFFAFYIDKPMCLAVLNKIQSYNGLNAVIVLSLVYLISNLLILPFGLPLNLLAGMLWGTLGGGVLINILAILVAAVSFYLGRWFGHYFLDDLYAKYHFLKKMKDTINHYDWQFITLARINPIIPFGLSNYFFGSIAELSFKHYIIVTAIANLIPCLAFASIGSIFRTVSFVNVNMHSLILKVGIAMLLVTALFLLKISLPKQLKNHAEI